MLLAAPAWTSCGSRTVSMNPPSECQADPQPPRSLLTPQKLLGISLGCQAIPRQWWRPPNYPRPSPSLVLLRYMGKWRQDLGAFCIHFCQRSTQGLSWEQDGQADSSLWFPGILYLWRSHAVLSFSTSLAFSKSPSGQQFHLSECHC